MAWYDKPASKRPTVIQTVAGETKAAALNRYKRENPGIDTTNALFMVPDVQQPGHALLEPLEGSGRRR